MAFPVENIKEICRAKNTTLAQLEKKLGIGNGVIGKWENSKNSPPYDRLLAIANELGVTVADLAGVEKNLLTERGEEDIRSEIYSLVEEATPEELRDMLPAIRRMFKK